MAERYSPVLGSKTDTQYNIRGMVLEVKAGRGPIVFDTSRIPEKYMGRSHSRRRLDEIEQ